MSENRNKNSFSNKTLVSGDEYLARKNGQYSYTTAKKKKAFPTRLVFIAVCAVVFCVSGFHLVRYFSDIHKSRNSTDALREIYASSQSGQEQSASQNPAAVFTPEPTAYISITETPQLTPAPTATEAEPETQPFSEKWPSKYVHNPEMIIDESFQVLRQENRDIVGWITIEGVLDEPVLQRDNEFYLTHDATQKKNVTGALFLDENCNLRTLTPNLVVHGHNMKEGAMFGVLKKYKLKDASFYKTHPFIQFDTLYEKSTYVIFAVTEISLSPEDHYYLPFWTYMDFENERDYKNFITRVREFSHFQTGVDVVPGDRLLTLATCSGTDNQGRLLVVARQVREGENTIDLQRGILSTTVK